MIVPALFVLLCFSVVLFAFFVLGTPDSFAIPAAGCSLFEAEPRARASETYESMNIQRRYRPCSPPVPSRHRQEEEGTEYLQFSCTLTELYSEIFDVPSSLLFWRVPLRKGQDGSIVLKGGQIISERKEL